MTEVLLDGPCAGMTEQEYTAMRQLDCRVAVALGWVPVQATEGDLYVNCKLWRCGEGGLVVARDGADGIPLYSLDMNSAWDAFRMAMTQWKFPARGLFFDILQQKAGLDPVVVAYPIYPDCLVTLMSEMERHLCEAIAETFESHMLRGIHPRHVSPRADAYDSTIEKEYFTETDDQGVEHQRVKLAAPEGTPPWVKWVKNPIANPEIS